MSNGEERIRVAKVTYMVGDELGVLFTTTLTAIPNGPAVLQNAMAIANDDVEAECQFERTRGTEIVVTRPQMVEWIELDKREQEAWDKARLPEPKIAQP